MRPVPAADDVTLDRFLGGKVAILQSRTGHRVGLDAALLQAAIPAGSAGTCLDFGTGVGAVAFSVAARSPAMRVFGLDIDADALSLAEAAAVLPENAALAGRVAFARLDLSEGRAGRAAAGIAEGVADWVVMNPPFNPTRAMSTSPDAKRRSAHEAEGGLLDAWCRAAAALLRPGGRIALIHRAEALAEVLDALSGRFGDLRVKPVHARVGEAAGRIILRGERGSRAPLQLLTGLVVHDTDGQFTAEADDILRGNAEISFSRLGAAP
jgi:tRNA1(Val) A37 N6-methylase TrmN6